MLQRLLPTVLVTIEIPQFRVDKVVDLPFLQVVQIIPVVVQRQIPIFLTVCRTKEIPQLLDIVIDVPVAQVVQFVVFVEALRRFPMVQAVDIPQLQFIDKVFDVPDSSGAGCENSVEIPQLQLVVCNDRCLVVQSAENIEGFAVEVL